MIFTVQFSFRTKHICMFLTACILAAGAFAFLFRYDNKYTARATVSQDGIVLLDCARLDQNQLTYLADGWELHPNVLLSPQELTAKSNMQQHIFIGQYANFAKFNHDSSPYGVATYRLRLKDSAP